MILGENRLEAINSFEHIWGYFKKKASKDEKTKFFLLLSNYKDEKAEYLDIIRYFNTLLLKYPNEYLSKSKIIKGDYNEIMAPRFNK